MLLKIHPYIVLKNREICLQMTEMVLIYHGIEYIYNHAIYIYIFEEFQTKSMNEWRISLKFKRIKHQIKIQYKTRKNKCHNNG